VQLNERTVHRRAVEAVIWAMPAVNMELLFQAMKDAKADVNQVVYWSRLPDWKNQTLTSNPRHRIPLSVLQHEGGSPMVLEIAPADDGSITGNGSRGRRSSAFVREDAGRRTEPTLAGG